MKNALLSKISIPDNPISSSEDDVFEWAPIANDFARQILKIDATKGLVVGLFGSWGSGKTSFINLTRPQFQRSGVPVLDFNPWLFSGTDQLVARFFSELSDTMRRNSSLEKVAKFFGEYGGILSSTVVTISALAGNPLAGNFLSPLFKFLSIKAREATSANALREKLTEALEQRRQPIVVVLDDVDRLSREEVRELFKLVRLTASFPNLIYIVACDRIRVENALEDRDAGARGSYLEKVFQWSISIPTAPREHIRRELQSGMERALGHIAPPFDEEGWSHIETEIIRPLVRNMRDVRRYCMAVGVTADDLGTSVAVIDVLALEAIRLFAPRFFEQLPHLVDHLTVPLTWKGDATPRADLVSEQEGDTRTAGELLQESLEEVLEAVDAQHRPVARSLIQRVFSGGRSQHDNEDPDWPIQQLKKGRVVHQIIFQLYFTRVEDGDVISFSCAKRAFECLHDPRSLDELMRVQDPDIRPKITFLLWRMFKNDFETRHAESVLVVFWNLLTDMPGRNSIDSDEPMQIIRILSETVLEALGGPDGASHSINNIFQQLKSLTSKVEFITQIHTSCRMRTLTRKKELLISEAELRALQNSLNNEILSTNTDELIRERHPAQILLFSAQQPGPPKAPHIIHDSPKLTFALMWDSMTAKGMGDVGSSTINKTRQIRWDILEDIHGTESMLKVRIKSLSENFSKIESWICSEFATSSLEARCVLQQAKTIACVLDKE